MWEKFIWNSLWITNSKLSASGKLSGNKVIYSLKSRKNPKILSETLKAIIGAHYYDSQFDLDHLRDVLQPLLKELLDK